MENALRVSHVSKDYPGFSSQDISFELPKGMQVKLSLAVACYIMQNR